MLDIIIPCYNEGKNLKEFYDNANECLKAIKHNFIFIDDGSSDETMEELKKIYNNDKDRIKIIGFARNFGKEAALYAGFLHAKNELVAVIDADLQQNPKYLVKMYKFLEENKQYDSIAMCQKQDKKRFLQTQFYNVMNHLSDVHLENGASDFRMFRQSVVAAIISLSEKNRFSKGIFSYVNSNTYYDEYVVEERKHGKSNFGFKNSMNYAINGIVAFSTKPLRYITYLGTTTVSISLLYLLIYVIKCLSKTSTSEISMLIFLILFFSGIIITCIGIVGEYVGKIYNETKNRPIFITKVKIGFDEEIL